MSDFVEGLPARQDEAASALRAAFEAADERFAPANLKAAAQAPSPVSFAPRPPGPKHFKPADPEGDSPTKGWDPLDPTIAETETGFVDPIAQAREQGYAEGAAAAALDALRATERDVALVSGIADALRAAKWVDRTALANQLRDTVLALVRRIVGEIDIPADLLAARISEAVAMIADRAEAATLKMNPADLALVSGKLGPGIKAVADPAIACGSFTIEAADTRIEDGLRTWLEQLTQVIDRVAVPTPGPADHAG